MKLLLRLHKFWKDEVEFVFWLYFAGAAIIAIFWLLMKIISALNAGSGDYFA